MKTLVTLLALPFVATAALAQQPSDQEIRLMAASEKAVEAYRTGGIAQMGREVDDCNGSLSRASGEEDAEYCIALSLATLQVDAMVTTAAKLPRDDRFTDASVLEQIKDTLLFTQVVGSPNEVMAYITPRNDRISRYVIHLVSGPSAAGDQASSGPATEGAAEAFEKFWTSTDCNELRELSQWDQLVNSFQSNDEQLCATFVQMHQQVRNVEVTKVQALPGNKARITATIGLSQKSMQQQDTFVLEDGRWVLSAR